jgi:hypothetical protein
MKKDADIIDLEPNEEGIFVPVKKTKRPKKRKKRPSDLHYYHRYHRYTPETGQYIEYIEGFMIGLDLLKTFRKIFR